MNDELLILLLGSPPGLRNASVIGINILLGDFGPEYRGKEIDRIFLSDIHDYFVVGVSKNIVLEFLADRPQLTQTVVGKEETNIGFPPKGYQVIQAWVRGGIEFV